jgi:DNA-binding beta-propeller fold protein YncE
MRLADAPFVAPQAIEGEAVPTWAFTLAFAPTSDAPPLASLLEGVYALAVVGQARIGNSAPFGWANNVIFGAKANGLTPPALDDREPYAFLEGLTLVVSDGTARLGDNALGDLRLQAGAWWQTGEGGDMLTPVPVPPIVAKPPAPSDDGQTLYGVRGIVGYERTPQAYFNTARYPFDAPDTLNALTLRPHLPLMAGDTLFAPARARVDLRLRLDDGTKAPAYPAYIDVRALRDDGTLLQRVLIGGDTLNDDARLDLSTANTGETLAIVGDVVGADGAWRTYRAGVTVVAGEHASVTPPFAMRAPVPVEAGLPVYSLPNPSTYPLYPTSTLLLTPRGRLLVVNPLLDSVSLLTPSTGTLDSEYAVGRTPSAVALVDGVVVTANAGDGTLSFIDVGRANPDVITRPSGLNTLAGVTLRNRETLAVWGDALALTPLSPQASATTQTTATLAPRTLAIWGDTAYALDDSGGLTLVYLPNGRSIAQERYLAGELHYHALTLDANRARLYVAVTQVQANAPLDVRHTPALLVIDLRTLSLLDVIALDTVSKAGELPTALALNPQRTHLYVAYGASGRVLVLNLQTRLADAQFEAGANPISIAFNRDGTRVYVHNAAEHSITVRDTQFFGLVDTLPTTRQTLPAPVQLGATLFYSAQLSWHESLACASCHTSPKALPTFADNGALNDHIRAQMNGQALDPLTAAALLAFLQAQVSP